MHDMYIKLHDISLQEQYKIAIIKVQVNAKLAVIHIAGKFLKQGGLLL